MTGPTSFVSIELDRPYAGTAPQIPAALGSGPTG
jgi:hypothetical protein